MSKKKDSARTRRHTRIRTKVKGTATRPRLYVYKSLLYTHADIIDDDKGIVLAGASDMTIKGKGTKTEKAKKVGSEIAKKAQEKKITEVVFDRGGFPYHGRIKALADGAREGGLKF